MTEVNSRKHYIICFVTSFFLRVIWFLYQKKMICIQDELGFMVVPSTLGGNDWSGAIGSISYYGFGYSILATPLYLRTNNPYVIYWSMMVIGAIVLALCSCLIYYLTIRYMEIDSGAAALVAITMPFLAVPEMRYLNNEPMIAMVIWGIVLLLVKLHYEEEKKQKVILSVLLIILMMYSLTIHNRMVAIVAALFFTLLMYRIIFKRWLVSIPVMAGMAVVGAVIVRAFIPYMERTFWKTDLREGVANTVASASGGMISGLMNLADPEYLGAVLRIVAGNFFMSSFHSCGVFCFALLAIIYQVVRLLRKKEQDQPQNIENVMTILEIFGWTAFMATLAGVALLWAGGVRDGMKEGYGVFIYEYKGFYYLRYYAACLSVIVYTVLIRMYHSKNTVSLPWKLRYVISVLFFSVAFMKLITPYIIGTNNGLYAFGCYGGYRADQEITEAGLYIWIFILSVILAMITLWLLGRNNSKGLITLTMMLLLFNYHGGAYTAAVITDSYEDKGDSGYKVFRYLESRVDYDREIYIRSASKHSFTAYQMLLCDYRIVPIEEFPEDMERGFVVTDRLKDEEKRKEDGFKLYRLDDNEYLWVKGYDISEEMFDLCGIEEG